MGLGDDLREIFVGVAEAIRGGRRAVHGARAAAGRLDGVVDPMTNGATVAGVARAGLGAAFNAVEQEARAATASSPQAQPEGQLRKCLGIACDRHGNQPWAVWRKTLVCGAEGCGRIYQTANASGRHFAPAVCACGAQLLPRAVSGGKLASGEPLCSPCFDEIASASGRAIRRGPQTGGVR